MESNETIVYFFENDWHISKNFERLLYCYLDGDMSSTFEIPIDFPEGIVCPTPEDIDKWAIDNKICVNIDMYDMATLFYVTATKEWVEKNFPEILPYVSERPKDEVHVYDCKYYLKYIPENFGTHYATSLFNEVPAYLAANRYAFPELFNS